MDDQDGYSGTYEIRDYVDGEANISRQNGRVGRQARSTNLLVPQRGQGSTVQEEEHRQRQMRDGDENEEEPEEQGDAAACAFHDAEKGQADGDLDDADAEDVDAFGDGAEFEHGDDGLWGKAGSVSTHP